LTHAYGCLTKYRATWHKPAGYPQDHE